MSTTDNVARSKMLSRQLSQVDKNLDKIVSRIATADNTSNAFWVAIQNDITKEYDKAKAIASEWIALDIPKTYRQDAAEQLAKIKAKKIPGLRDVTFSQFANTDLSKQSIQSLIDQTVITFATRLEAGKMTMIQLSRLTQQILIDEKLLTRNIASGFIEGGSVNAAKKKLQNELLKNALGEKYVTVIDRNGKITYWNIKKYAEMVARTKLQETSTQAVVNTTMAVGGDLVQVSSHNTQTAFDAQFEGKIYSLSGNSKQFPVATILPPFHPNCIHSITTVFAETLAIDGTLDKYVDFSNGKSEIHPTRKSHTPVSDRDFTA